MKKASAKSGSGRPFIAVLVETSTTWGSGIVRGIYRYVAEHGPWLIHIEPTGRFEQPRLPRGWRGDGILARVTTRDYARYLERRDVPLVNVSSSDPSGGRIPHCSIDIAAVGRLAATHFLERGYRRFAYVGTTEKRDQPVNLQYATFAQMLARSGYTVEVLELADLLRAGKRCDALSPDLARWLRALPKPVAVFTWTSVEGRRVAEACRLANIHVPEEVAILSGEYDELICNSADPPLSAVEYSSQTVGYRAAALLHQLLRGKRPPRRPTLIPPKGVVTRQSTDMVAIDDPQVWQALSYLRQHALGRLSVADVVAHVGVSRRALELRFQQVVGRSPAEEIRYLRLLHASKLLQETATKLESIASATGFSNRNIFARNFERAYGLSPSAYRKQFRGQDDRKP